MVIGEEERGTKLKAKGYYDHYLFRTSTYNISHTRR